MTRTSGRWTIEHGGVFGEDENLIADTRDDYGNSLCDTLDQNYIHANANAHTIAIAGTTANEIDALGYDGDNAIENLHELFRLGLIDIKDGVDSALAGFIQSIEKID